MRAIFGLRFLISAHSHAHTEADDTEDDQANHKMNRGLNVILVEFDRRELVRIVPDPVAVGVNPFISILGESVDAVVIPISIVVCNERIQTETLLFKVRNAIAVVVGIRVIADSVAVSVEPFFGVERKDIIVIEVSVIIVVIVLDGILAAILIPVV